MPKPTKVILIAAIVLAVAACLMLLQKHRARAAERELAALLPRIASVTVYDIGDASDPKALATAASAPFPVEVFRQSCASATHESGPTLWKGSSVAVLTLSDGTLRYARFSYYGGFFTLERASGRFIVLGGSSSEFHRLYLRLIQEQFVPKRHERIDRNA